MPNHKENDPYIYPDSSVLINKFDTRNADEYIKANIHGFNGDYNAVKNVFLSIASPIAIAKEAEMTADQRYI